MSATVWDGGDASSTGQNLIGKERFTATLSQQLFTLTTFTYTVDANSLLVFVNGVYQIGYAETSSSSITLDFATLNAGDIVDIVGFNVAYV